MRYVVSYDLGKPVQNYQELWDALDKLGAKRALQSQWCLRHNNTTAARLRDYFWRFMDSDDRLLVNSIDGVDWAGMNLINKISNM